jgi:AcrR family transcriptional regulator
VTVVSAETTARRSRRSPDRQRELLDAALRVIRRSGPPVAMEAIAAEAGITRPVLYRHFGDVGGLYGAVAARFAEDLLGRLGNANARRRGGRALVRTQVDAYLGFLEAEPNLYRFLSRQFPAERADGQTAVADFVRLVGDIVVSFLQRAGYPPLTAEVAGRGLVGTIQAAADWWLDHPDVPRSKMVEEITSFAWSGFSAVVDRRP